MTVQITPRVEMGILERVEQPLTQWGNVVGCRATGNSLAKVLTTSNWDAAAASVAQLEEGDGYVEVTVIENNTHRMFGLSNSNTSVTYIDIDFAMFLHADGTLYVYESGVLVAASVVAYAPGDVLRVAVVGGVVKYSKNGAAAFYTSLATPTYPLIVDTSFFSPDATLANVVFDFTSVATSWVDLSSDVVSGVKAEWGIHDSGPTSRVAEPGTMTFDLDNSAANSGGARGYYSPGHAAARAGFVLSAPVRLVLHNDLLGDRVKWVGTIAKITPKSGARSPLTSVYCVDWMDQAVRAKPAGLEVQVDVQSDVLFTTIISSLAVPPPGGVRVGTGSDIYPYALDNTQDEETRILSELQKLAMSEYGIVQVTAGELVFEGRRGRGGGGAVQLTLDEDENVVAMTISAHDQDAVINRVQVAIHPRRRDAAATTQLFNLGSAIEIQRNTSVVINCPFRDPNQQAQRVGGVDMVQPVAVTDYVFFENANGTGADLTAQLSVAAVYDGNSAAVTVMNNGPSDGWIPADGLQFRGRGLYDFEPVLADRRDAESSAANGEKSLSYDMPYQSNPSNAIDLAQFILALYKDPAVRAEAVTFIANWADDTAEQAFNLEVSDRVAVNAPTVGLAAVPHFVNGFKYDVRMSGLVLVTLTLSPVDTSQFWVLEELGRTELDETTILGYGLFAAGWILDTSELGADTFLN